MKNRTAYSSILIAITAAIVLALVCIPMTHVSAASGKMTITAIDLLGSNTGEATMITAGDGGALLVDSGDNHNDSIFDWLNKNGYKNKTFNTLVTHWHDDHAGNTAEIIRKYKVGTVYLPNPSYLNRSDHKSYYRYEKSYYTNILSAAKARGTKIVYLKKGQTINVGSGVSGKVLYINESPYSENWYPIQYINNQSSVIMFTGGGVKYLTAGDIQEQAENRLLKSGVSLEADIFKMSHHGYIRSNTQNFIKAVNPAYAYFSCFVSTPSSYCPGDLRDGVTRMGKIANVHSTRYNGTIKYVCSNGEIKVTAQRNTSKMYQKLINKSTGKTKNVTYTFNSACPVHMSDKVIDTSVYYNRQLKSSGSTALFTGSMFQSGNYYCMKNGNIYAWNSFAVKDGKTYFFDRYYRRLRGFVGAYGRRYYFAPSMVTGWKTINGKRYYFMDRNCTCYTTSNRGAMVTGWKTISGKRYYFMDKSCDTYSYANSGKRMLGFFKVEGNTYYAANSKMEGYVPANIGVIQKYWKTINGRLYYFGSNGVMRTGWQTIDGKTYYMNGSGVTSRNKFVLIDGNLYYFDKNGVMQTGWIEVDGKKYYAFEDGKLATGKVTIDVVEYEFDTVENGCALLTPDDQVTDSSLGDTATETALEDPTEAATDGSTEGITEAAPEDAGDGSTDGTTEAAPEDIGDGSTDELPNGTTDDSTEGYTESTPEAAPEDSSEGSSEEPAENSGESSSEAAAEEADHAAEEDAPVVEEISGEVSVDASEGFSENSFDKVENSETMD